LRRALPGGYELDDDAARVDVHTVHRYLAEESYWARGRTREQVQRTIREAARVVGLYRGAEQVGFARVLSDNVHFAYLADVFITAPHRGKGLGVELVKHAVDGGRQKDLMWILGTRDAHTLYEKLGFKAPDERWMVRDKQL
jgi:GNAT superfamily N-acetyltransferase